MKLIIILISMVLLTGCSIGSNNTGTKPVTETDIAIQKAQELFKQKQKEKLSISDGPCLTNELMEDWVADIAHNPRQPVDELPENQCSAYVNNQVSHFVELDVTGKVIRVQ